jgi:hypothetical protein
VALPLKQHLMLLLSGDLHYLRLSSAQDLWYVVPGPVRNRSFGFAGNPGDGEKSLGLLRARRDLLD